jgi:dipeptidyl aminopeptidase/acylaminoacyl peptidase
VVLAKTGGTWRELLRRQHQGRFQLYGVNRDATAVIISGTNDQNRSTLLALPIDGSAGKTLFDDPVSGVSHAYYDRFTNAPLAAALEGIEQKTFWFDPTAEKQFRTIAKAFPEKSVTTYEWSENGKRTLAKVQGPSSPPIYYLIDFDTHKADIVGEQYPGLANVTLGEMRPIDYKARDGANIPAYLTLPPKSTEKLPLVVLPHSDMEGRDDYIFDWLSQFLASRGYAVLQPQFRGSSGFGEAWRKAGKGQWGKLMQSDLTDGVQAMIDQGIADSQRICIVGVQYGGYAALAGAAFTPQLYRCAVSINGLADLPELIAYQKRHWGDDSDLPAYWQDLIGSPFDPDVIDKSPVKAAKQITAPILLMHATDDSVFPPAQSDSMFRALKQYKKPVTLIRLDGEDHWLSTSAARRKMLAEIEKFLDANLH